MKSEKTVMPTVSARRPLVGADRLAPRVSSERSRRETALDSGRTVANRQQLRELIERSRSNQVPGASVPPRARQTAAVSAEADAKPNQQRAAASAVPQRPRAPLREVFRGKPLEMSFVAASLFVAVLLLFAFATDLAVGWPFGRCGALLDVCMAIGCAGLIYLCRDAYRGIRRRF